MTTSISKAGATIKLMRCSSACSAQHDLLQSPAISSVDLLAKTLVLHFRRTLCTAGAHHPSC
eukprot:566217-Amphidinium_carterae.2